jgi:kynurenine formamidase
MSSSETEWLARQRLPAQQALPALQELSARLQIAGRTLQVDLARPLSLAIELDFDGAQPHWYAAPPAHSAPLVTGGFSGRVDEGASCNCSTITLTPHCNGTHTECVGHLTRERLDACGVVPRTLLPAVLLSVTPQRATDTTDNSVPAPQPEDLLITRQAIERAWPEAPAFAPRALVLRTLPNDALKRTRDYCSDPAAYLSLQAAALLVGRDIEHLVLDVPSADRAEDAGHLSAHRVFFGLPSGSTRLAEARRPHCTITELAYVDNVLSDGCYLLALQTPALSGDAVPSQPLLYPVTVA